MIRQMAKPEFLQKLGVFIVRDFFDPYQCAQLSAEIGAASFKPATVLETAEEGYVLDENFRKVLRAEPSHSAEVIVRSRLHELKPKLEEHFQITLAGCNEPQFLRYEPGGFFGPHPDTGPDAPPHVAARRVSVVLFLNAASEKPSPGCYGGGALRFHGLLSGPRWGDCAFSLEAEAGLLVAFKSTVLHEVLPVTFGQRMTVATWFTGP
jgi:SM-20-related protein